MYTISDDKQYELIVVGDGKKEIPLPKLAPLKDQNTVLKPLLLHGKTGYWPGAGSNNTISGVSVQGVILRDGKGTTLCTLTGAQLDPTAQNIPVLSIQGIDWEKSTVVMADVLPATNGIVLYAQIA